MAFTLGLRYVKIYVGTKVGGPLASSALSLSC